MRALREVYDFVTGGSVATPIGVSIALGTAVTTAGTLASGPRALVVTAILLATLVAAALEPPR